MIPNTVSANRLVTSQHVWQQTEGEDCFPCKHKNTCRRCPRKHSEPFGSNLVRTPFDIWKTQPSRFTASASPDCGWRLREKPPACLPACLPSPASASPPPPPDARLPAPQGSPLASPRGGGSTRPTALPSARRCARAGMLTDGGRGTRWRGAARLCSARLGWARLGSARTMRRAAACLRALCLLLQLRAAGERGRPRAGRGAAAHLLWRGPGWRRAGCREPFSTAVSALPAPAAAERGLRAYARRRRRLSPSIPFSSLSSSSGAGGVEIRLRSQKQGYEKGQFLPRRPSLRGGGGDNPAVRGASLRVGFRYVREVVRLRSGLLWTPSTAPRSVPLLRAELRLSIPRMEAESAVRVELSKFSARKVEVFPSLWQHCYFSGRKWLLHPTFNFTEV